MTVCHKLGLKKKRSGWENKCGRGRLGQVLQTDSTGPAGRTSRQPEQASWFGQLGGRAGQVSQASQASWPGWARPGQEAAPPQRAGQLSRASRQGKPAKSSGNMKNKQLCLINKRVRVHMFRILISTAEFIKSWNTHLQKFMRWVHRPPQDFFRNQFLYIQTPDQPQSGRYSYILYSYYMILFNYILYII